MADLETPQSKTVQLKLTAAERDCAESPSSCFTKSHVWLAVTSTFGQFLSFCLASCFFEIQCASKSEFLEKVFQFFFVRDASEENSQNQHCTFSERADAHSSSFPNY